MLNDGAGAFDGVKNFISNDDGGSLGFTVRRGCYGDFNVDGKIDAIILEGGGVARYVIGIDCSMVI